VESDDARCELSAVPLFVDLDERGSHVSKRNMIWLAVVLAVGVLGWLAFGIAAGLIAAAVALVVSEVVERRARKQRRAARDGA